LGCRKVLGQLLDLRGLAGALAAFKGNELAASGRPLRRCLVHAQSFSALARNMPMTSSLAPSIARRMVEPAPTASAAYTGASIATLAPRQTRTTPTAWPSATGARTGPL